MLEPLRGTQGSGTVRPVPQNRLRELREAARLTRTQLAERVGVHPSTVGRWEDETMAFPDERKQHVAEVLGVSVAYLMGWDAPDSNGESENGAERVA